MPCTPHQFAAHIRAFLFLYSAISAAHVSSSQHGATFPRASLSSTVLNREVLSSRITRLTIASPPPPPFSYISIRHPNGRTKPYIPYHLLDTSHDTCNLLIKTSTTGTVSTYLATLNSSDKLYRSPPILKQHRMDVLSHSHIGLIVGGVGIATALQVLETLLRTGHHVSLLYAVDFHEDLCHLSWLQKLSKEQLSFTFSTIVRYPSLSMPSLSSYTGTVTRDIIEQCMPPQHLQPFIGVSGPKALADILLAKDGIISSIGYVGAEI